MNVNVHIDVRLLQMMTLITCKNTTFNSVWFYASQCFGSHYNSFPSTLRNFSHEFKPLTVIVTRWAFDNLLILINC